MKRKTMRQFPETRTLHWSRRRARHPVGVRCPAPAKNTLDPDMDADDYSTSRNCDGAIAGGESESSSATLTVW